MMNKIYIIKIIVFFSSMLFLTACDGTKAKPELTSATLLPAAKVINDFDLKHDSDGDFNLKSLKGKWSLFFFGYTRCPDVCPTELYMLSEMMALIEQKPDSVQQIPQVIFVSVDPQQDKLKALKEYAEYYHPSFKGVTGEQNEVDKLASTMGVFYERAYMLNQRALVIDEDDIPEGLENSYLINHSASIILTNPKGQMHAVFSNPHVPSTIIEDLNKIQLSW